jgi:VanZ family protein
VTHGGAGGAAPAHAATAALLTAALVAVLPGRSLARAAAGVLVLSLAWEAAEWASDALFQTQFAPSTSDTLSDLAFDLVGAVVGAAVIAAHASTSRRAHRAP